MSEKRPDRATQSRFPWAEFEQIENWRRAQPQIPSISAAVRTLVNLGLRASPGRDAAPRPPAKERAA